MNDEISDLVNGYEGKTISKIVLPKKYDCYKICADYVVGTEAEGYQNTFVKKLLEENAKKTNLIKRAYERDGRVTLVLEDRFDEKATGKIDKLLGNYFSSLTDELTGIKLKSKNAISIDGSRLDVIAENGHFDVVEKSPINVTSLLNQNSFSSAPVYTACECANDRGNGKYIL